MDTPNLSELARSLHTVKSQFPQDEIVDLMVECSVRMAQAVTAVVPETSHQAMSEFVRIVHTGS
jgi:hypothetical protein